MKFNAAHPYVAAFVVFRQDDKVAFLLRQNTNWMNGRYGLPAGKANPGESARQAAIREAREEVGVDVAPEDLRHLVTVYRTSSIEYDDTLWLDVIFEAVKWQGELHNAEPHKHGELTWFDPGNLPDNTTPYMPFFFDQIKAGNAYAELGW